eukprot:145812-Chlamydomonas_euryale.AAC.2
MAEPGMKFGVVVSRFNSLVTKALLEGAMEDFESRGVRRDNVDVGDGGKEGRRTVDRGARDGGEREGSGARVVQKDDDDVGAEWVAPQLGARRGGHVAWGFPALPGQRGAVVGRWTGASGTTDLDASCAGD